MTIPGFTDQELADQLRAKGVPQWAIESWLDKTRPSVMRSDERACFDSLLREAKQQAAPTPAPKPDRGRTGPKRASTARRSEASVQHEIVMALKAAGFYVRRIGQRNAKGTMDPGVPDLYAIRSWRFDEMVYPYGPRGWEAWIECKRSHGGRQSVAQREFQRMCEHAGVRYILAKSVDDIRELL